MPSNSDTPMPHPHPVSMVQQLAKRFAGKADGPAAISERIPVSHYTDPGRFAAEREHLFLRTPQVLAHESQIPEPGDAIVQDWLGLPMVTVRDPAGGINTFLNVCRHRGMRIVQDEGQACLRSFVCPYHQWTYGLDGALRNVPRPETFAELDRDAHALVPVATAVRNGLIWIQARGEMNIDAHLISTIFPWVISATAATACAAWRPTGS